MENWQSRQIPLIGENGNKILSESRVCIIGIGGVGGGVLEGLVRCGIGHITVVDGDVFDVTNLNRQLLATVNNIGKYKVDVAKERSICINPNIDISTERMYVREENITAVLERNKFDFVCDAIDDVRGKVAIIKKSDELNIPVISCMGTGNRLTSETMSIKDIFETVGCPLARSVRSQLRRAGVKKCPVLIGGEGIKTGNFTPASISYVPNIAGFKIAEYVVRNLLEK